MSADPKSPEPPQPDPTAPQGLDKMFQLLKGHHDRETKKARRAGIALRQSHKFFCGICGKTHNDATQLGNMVKKLVTKENPIADRAINERKCAACQKNLDAGMIAIVCDEEPRRYAFVYSEALADNMPAEGPLEARQILEVSSKVMDALQQRFKVQTGD